MSTNFLHSISLNRERFYSTEEKEEEESTPMGITSLPANGLPPSEPNPEEEKEDMIRMVKRLTKKFKKTVDKKTQEH